MTEHSKLTNALGVPPPWDSVVPPITRLFVWLMIGGVLFLLRSFFLLMFLTFVFAYIQGQAVDRLEKRIGCRPLRAILVALFFLAFLIGVGRFIAPQVRDQAHDFARNYSTYLKTVDRELLKLSDDYPAMSIMLPPLKDLRPAEANGSHSNDWDPRKSPSMAVLQPLLGIGDGGLDSDNIKSGIETIKLVGSRAIGIVYAFLLSLLFSFLIVLDFPRLSRVVKDLADTKVGFIYNEAAGSIYGFCTMLGRAFEAQFYIAIVNTLLTAFGIWLIGLQGELVFVSMIVFFCSFIPIAGVFISSIPICLLSLQQGGFSMVGLAILLIVVIHLIEAYILNPKIYGQHLRMNPVVVLMILTIGGKVFGVWGLVLGLPICTYIVHDAIQYKTKRARPSAAPVS